MSPKPLEEVTLGDLATKDDLKDLVTKDYLHQELGSAVNLIMGELGKMSARQEEMAGTLARLVARSEGVMQ
ncbi:hypothetical protein [Actinomadura latina]|uniref:Uncharacterized protein n=1 Tax=Actinomadura latina TaxID=163603 RepID=A0A846YYQ1_9ACTN|nr:hypothetical protein [Actinomadura latina]NKZ05191.1 hypothetical protein [Actinomadura latina]